MRKFHAKTRPNILDMVIRNGYDLTGTLSHGGSQVASEATRIACQFNGWFQN